MAFAEQASRSRVPTIAAVALIHVGIGYAFISGLAMNVIHETFPVFTVNTIVDRPPPPPDTLPPPPQHQTPTERVTAPTTVVTLAPIPDLSTLPVATLPQVPIAGPIVRADPVVPAPPSALASAARPKGNKAEWITTDDYPPAALRAGDEGIVAIRVGIDARGRVSDCAVTGSSGSPTLDDATCRLYARRARFAPALDDAGAPVGASYTDRIRWQIPH